MLVIPILEGFSASVTDYNMADAVTDMLLESKDVVNYKMCHIRSKILDRKGNEKILRFIFENEDENNILLCVGKSLGAKRMVNNILNRLAMRDNKLKYKYVACLTVDPNWPLWYDLSPNLNNRKLLIKYPVDNFYNIRVVGSKRQQCGAKVCCKYFNKTENEISKNINLYNNYDHYNITKSTQVKYYLQKLIKESNCYGC